MRVCCLAGRSGARVCVAGGGVLGTRHSTKVVVGFHARRRKEKRKKKERERRSRHADNPALPRRLQFFAICASLPTVAQRACGRRRAVLRRRPCACARQCAARCHCRALRREADLRPPVHSTQRRHLVRGHGRNGSGPTGIVTEHSPRRSDLRWSARPVGA